MTTEQNTQMDQAVQAVLDKELPGTYAARKYKVDYQYLMKRVNASRKVDAYTALQAELEDLKKRYKVLEEVNTELRAQVRR